MRDVDFMSAKRYSYEVTSNLDSITAFSPIYYISEVALQEICGFKADKFSLACVFAEMIATLLQGREDLLGLREPTETNDSTPTFCLYDTFSKEKADRNQTFA